MVGVQVGDEHVGDVGEADRARQLTLGALTAVEQDAGPAPAHEQRGHASARRGRGCGRACEEQREVHLAQRGYSQVIVRQGYFVPMAYAPTARHLLRAKDLADARTPSRSTSPTSRRPRASPPRTSAGSSGRVRRVAARLSADPRLERAAALLTTTDRSVAEICFEVGAAERRVVHDELHADLRRVPDGVPGAVPVGRRPGARARLHRPRLRPSATPHVSRRRGAAPGLASSSTPTSTPRRTP